VKTDRQTEATDWITLPGKRVLFAGLKCDSEKMPAGSVGKFDIIHQTKNT